jgi:hypothetical protein
LWGVYYANGVYVVVGQETGATNIWYNTECTPAGTDTVNGWTKSTMLSTGMDGVVYRSVAGNGSTFVTVGNGGWKDRRILYSTDGAQNWYHADISALSSDDPRFRCVIWSGVDFVAVGETILGPVVFRSPDGINWSIDNSVDPGSNYELRDVWANQNTAVKSELDRERNLSSDIDIFVETTSDIQALKLREASTDIMIEASGDLTVYQSALESSIDAVVDTSATLSVDRAFSSSVDVIVDIVESKFEKILHGELESLIEAEISTSAELDKERYIGSSADILVDSSADLDKYQSALESSTDILVDTAVEISKITAKLLEDSEDIFVDTSADLATNAVDLEGSGDVLVDAGGDIDKYTLFLESSTNVVFVTTNVEKVKIDPTYLESKDEKNTVIGVTTETTKIIAVNCGC